MPYTRRRPFRSYLDVSGGKKNFDIGTGRDICDDGPRIAYDWKGFCKIDNGIPGGLIDAPSWRLPGMIMLLRLAAWAIKAR